MHVFTTMFSEHNCNKVMARSTPCLALTPNKRDSLFKSEMVWTSRKENTQTLILSQLRQKNRMSLKGTTSNSCNSSIVSKVGLAINIVSFLLDSIVFDCVWRDKNTEVVCFVAQDVVIRAFMRANKSVLRNLQKALKPVNFQKDHQKVPKNYFFRLRFQA